MKPRTKLATAKTPDGGEMALYQHDRDFSIMVNGHDLMHSRQHESELELARLGCAHLSKSKQPRILIGGLGLGYSLRQVLDMHGAYAKVVVSELVGAVVEWNRTFMAELNGHALNDQRVHVRTGDVFKLLAQSANAFDAILLDIDNGPRAITDSGNRSLYHPKGLAHCRNALREKGCLAVWSSEPDKAFEKRLMDSGFHVSRFRVPAYKGSKSLNRFVFVASQEKASLPPGGGELRAEKKKESKARPRGGRKSF